MYGYATGVVLLMFLSLLVSNVPGFALSQWIDIPWRREASAGLFVVGASLGGWAVYRASLRGKQPWKYPQSQVTLPYAGFFLITLCAIFLSK